MMLFLNAACIQKDVYRHYKFEKNRDNPIEYKKADSYCEYKSADYIIKKSATAKYIPADTQHNLYTNCMKYKGWDAVSHRKEERVRQ